MSVLSTYTLADLMAFLARLQAHGRPRPAKERAADHKDKGRPQ